MGKKIINEELNRIKSLMGLINEQNTHYGILDRVIDVFMPGTPVKDGRDLLKKFEEIIKRRIDYNKKNNLPIDTLTPEEKTFRERIYKATPNYNYPHDINSIAKIIQDINQGKDIQPQLKQRKIDNYNKTKSQGQYGDPIQNLGSRQELKRMWLGIDEPDGQNKGFWIKSEFKPSTSKDPNAIYYKPKEIPKLTTQQFDELYAAIMKTKKPDGKFPGGNSSTVLQQLVNSPNKIPTAKLRSDMGNFKFGAGEENGKKYISVYDEWDLVPPKLKEFGVNIQKYGKTPLIYYRIYRQ